MASYIGLLAWPTASLAWIINIIQRGKAAWKRIDAILQTESEFQGKNSLNLKKPKSKKPNPNCEECSSKITAGDMFCTSCGTKR